MKFGLLTIATTIAAASLTTAATAQDSVAARKDKMAYVAVDAIGFTMMPVSGVRAAYLINPDLAVEGGYSTGSASIGDFKAVKSIVELKAKYFVSNSFYVDGGFAHESWDVNYPVVAASGSLSTTDLEGSVANNGASLHIGNQWQWSGFTVGCDWVGYFLSLNTTSSFKDNTAVSQENKTAQESDVKTAMGGNSVHLLRLYGGWAF